MVSCFTLAGNCLILYSISNVCLYDCVYRYVAEKLELSVFDPMYRAFANVFENFRISDASLRNKADVEDVKPEPEELAKALSKVPKVDLDDDLDEVMID